MSDSGADLRAVQTAALLGFLCQSLLDEALLSTLPPSNMAQSEPLHTQADAAASTSLDHQDTADPLSTPPPFSSLTLLLRPRPSDERRRQRAEVINQSLQRLPSSAVSQ